MNTCPKCGGFRMSGPHYNERTYRLDYRCTTCGYTSSEPTKDATPLPPGLEEMIRLQRRTS